MSIYLEFPAIEDYPQYYNPTEKDLMFLANGEDFFERLRQEQQVLKDGESPEVRDYRDKISVIKPNL